MQRWRVARENGDDVDNDVESDGVDGDGGVGNNNDERRRGK